MLCVSSSLVFSDISWAIKPTQEEIRNLIEKLNTNDEWEREKTIEELGKNSHDKDAITQLVKAALENESLLVRDGVKKALIYSYDGIVTDELITALEDRDKKIRRRAIEWLRDISYGLELKASEFVPKLIELLNDEESLVRSNAAYLLGSLGEKAATDEVIKALTKLLNDEDKVRSNAVNALKYIGETAANDEVIKTLTKLLNDEDKVRSNAVNALKYIGEKAATDEAIKALTKLLNDKDDSVRSKAALALGSMGEKAATDELIKALTKLLNHKNDSVRSRAAYGLGKMGEKAATDEVIKGLTKLLNDKDDLVRHAAADALGMMGEKAATDEIIKAFTKLLNDKNDSLRSGAVSVLGRMGEKAATETKLLNDNDKDDLLRSGAVSVLGRMGEKAATDEVITALTNILNDKDDSVRSSTASALGRMGEKAATDEVITALTNILNDKDDSVRSSTASAFTNIAINIQDKAQANQLSLSEFDRYIPKLEKALEIIENPENDLPEYTVASLRRSLLVIKDKRKALFWNSLFKNPFIIIPSAYLIFFPSLWFLLLRLKPILLIQINEILKPYEFSLPNELGGVPIRTRDLLLFSFFKFRPRVLDAWVKKNIPSARERFELKKTVGERSIHIPVAATLNNQDSLVVTGKDLKPTFNKNRACLLIWGEGGAGKTSLACQVGRWVMSDDSQKRPAQHLMLPVLIEEELRLKEHQEDEKPLLEAIQGQL